MTDRTPGPWTRSCFQVYGGDKSRIAHTGMGQLPPSRAPESEANAAAIVLWENHFDDLVKALQLQEDAELAHANCEECEGEDIPECCPKCFPLFDDARVARRTILAKVKS